MAPRVCFDAKLDTRRPPVLPMTLVVTVLSGIPNGIPTAR
jgi:hypothetical protein